MPQFEFERFRLPSSNYSINWVLAGFDPQWPNLNLAVADFEMPHF